MRKRQVLLLLITLTLALPTYGQTHPFQDDIFYQIFPIAFRDSDGDGFGDFSGIVEAIPYLQDLNITAVWMNPVFYSRAYHGYQYVRHDSLNPRFGTEAEFIAMVEALHDAGIEVYVDLVAYGISEEHPFFQDARGNPASDYDEWFAFTDPSNWNYFGFGGGYTDWQGNWITHVFWNHNHSPVRQYLIDQLAYWLDPDEDGDFHDGIDGFRIDHLSIGNYSESQWGYDLPLWDDISAGLRAVNPEVSLIAEESDWGRLRPELFDHGVEASFAIPVMFGLQYGVGNQIGWDMALWLSWVMDDLPDNGQWVGILNNHDVNRVYHSLGEDEELSRLAAVILLTGPLPPCLYYGEEIGMRGHKVDWYGNDANDLHVREPMEWSTSLAVPPHAQWYRGYSQYVSNQFVQDGDGISVQEQESDSGSLLNHYRSLAALRAEHAVLRSGAYDPVWVGDDRVYACLRHDDTSSVLVAANLAGQAVNLEVDFGGTPLGLLEREVTDLWQGQSYADITAGNADQYPLSIAAREAVILGIGGTIDSSSHDLIFQLDLSPWDFASDLFPPEVRGDTYPLSWYYGLPMEEISYTLWQAQTQCKGSLHGQAVEYKFKLTGRGFEDHSVGWSPNPNLTFTVDTTQHPQIVSYNASGWPPPYLPQSVRFVIDLSHWEQQPFDYDLEIRGDFPPLDWYTGFDAEYDGNGLWSRTVTMTLGLDSWFYYKFKLNGPGFSQQGQGWTPGANCFAWADLYVDTMVVIYDGETWNQPYETAAEPATEGELPGAFRLEGNYPNPFNASTTFRLRLPDPCRVKLAIYNIRGQRVATLVDGLLQAGEHRIPWRPEGLGSGIYFYQLTAGERRAAGKCLLVR